MPRHDLLAVVGAVALGAWSTTARAEPPLERVHLSWVRDEGAADACPGAATIQADVAERLGFSPFSGAETESASIEVLVTKQPRGFAAAVVMHDASGALRGTRRVESDAADCASLADAAGLAIAVMIDPSLLVDERKGQAPPVATTKPAPTPPPPAAPPPPVVAVDHAPKAALEVGVSVAAGVLPSVALGPLLRGELYLSERFALALGGQFFPEQERSRVGAVAHFSLALGSIGPCYRVELGASWALASCASLHVGSLGVAVASPDPAEVGARLWLATSLGLRLGLRLGPVEMSLAGEGLARLDRRRYEVERQAPLRRETAFSEPAVAGVGSLTTGVRF